MEQKVVNKTFFVELPSEGKLYEQDSPLSEGDVELRYGSSGDENILTNQFYVSRGEVFDRLLEQLLVNKSIKIEDLIIGDKNALVIGTRQAMYGNKYKVNITCPKCNEKIEVLIDLQKLGVFKVPEGVKSNNLEFKTEAGNTWKFHILTEGEMKMLQEEAKKKKKLRLGDGQVQMTARIELAIDGVNDSKDKREAIDIFRGISSIESQELRTAMLNMSPDIDLAHDYECENPHCDYEDYINIELNADFFWPSGRSRTGNSRRSI